MTDEALRPSVEEMDKDKGLVSTGEPHLRRIEPGNNASSVTEAGDETDITKRRKPVLSEKEKLQEKQAEQKVHEFTNKLWRALTILSELRQKSPKEAAQIVSVLTRFLLELLLPGSAVEKQKSLPKLGNQLESSLIRLDKEAEKEKVAPNFFSGEAKHRILDSVGRMVPTDEKEGTGRIVTELKNLIPVEKPKAA